MELPEELQSGSRFHGCGHVNIQSMRGIRLGKVWGLIVVALVVGALAVYLRFFHENYRWREEVDLRDGDTVVVRRWVKYHVLIPIGGPISAINTGTSLQILDQHPEVPVWRDVFDPLVLMRDPCTKEFVLVVTTDWAQTWEAHGKPNPAYWMFRLRNGQWVEEPLADFIFDQETNLVQGPGFADRERGIITLQAKEDESEFWTGGSRYRRILEDSPIGMPGGTPICRDLPRRHEGISCRPARPPPVCEQIEFRKPLPSSSADPSDPLAMISATFRVESGGSDEDRVFVARRGERNTIAIVCDGVSNSGKGSIAADIAIRELSRQGLERSVDWDRDLLAADQLIGSEAPGGETSCVALDVSEAGEIHGASVGDSGAWLVHDNGLISELTVRQDHRKLGSGSVHPVQFSSQLTGRLVLGSGGLVRNVQPAGLLRLAAHGVDALVDDARLKDGSLPDDVAVVLIEKRGATQ